MMDLMILEIIDGSLAIFVKELCDDLALISRKLEALRSQFEEYHQLYLTDLPSFTDVQTAAKKLRISVLEFNTLAIKEKTEKILSKDLFLVDQSHEGGD